LDTLQAAVLSTKLRYLDGWIYMRQQKAEVYNRYLQSIEGIEPPYSAPHVSHVFNYYTIRLQSNKINRQSLQEHLSSQGIDNRIYYPCSLHLEPRYRFLDFKLRDFPNSELAQQEVLSLPIYPELDDAIIRKIVEEINQYIQL
jgi:dTDP-4-amino-4,6-dideoxygalactose transaminase